MRTAAAVLAAAVLAALALAGEALACSCAPVELERSLPRADGAFVGTLLERREPRPAKIRSSADPVTLVFRVEAVYRGEIGSRIEVVTAGDGAACGIELAVGQRTGLLLDRKQGAWHSGLCSQIEPAAFLELTDVDDNALPTINWGGYLIGFLVLGAGGLFLVRRLRAGRSR